MIEIRITKRDTQDKATKAFAECYYTSTTLSWSFVTFPRGHAIVVLDGPDDDTLLNAIQALLAERWREGA